jgi:hypothetical protein
LRSVCGRPEYLQIIRLTRRNWLVKWLVAHPDRSAVLLNAFTVRIPDCHASIHFPTRCRQSCPMDANHQQRGIRFNDVRRRNFCCFGAAASFDSFYLSCRRRSNSSSGPALAPLKASIHEQHVLVDKPDGRREMRVQRWPRPPCET